MDAHTTPPQLQPSSHALSPAHFSLLSRVIRGVARAHRLGPDDAEDFGQTVHLRLLERGYDVFRSFEGRSSLSTYLHVVVTRLLLDWRNATRGKWRPSATAVRLGGDAVALDRLVNRDGLTHAEAIATLAAQKPASEPDTERALAAVAEALPTRARRTFVPETVAERESRLWVDFDDPVAAAEARRQVRDVRTRLRQACAALPPGDRQLIGLRYGRQLTVQAIGQRLGTDRKPLYRRLERSLSQLRRSMTGASEIQARTPVPGRRSIATSGERQS